MYGKPYARWCGGWGWETALGHPISDIIDFKTDQPPKGKVEKSHQGYVRQINTYETLLAQAGLTKGREVRKGLLFSADGKVRWV